MAKSNGSTGRAKKKSAKPAAGRTVKRTSKEASLTPSAETTAAPKAAKAAPRRPSAKLPKAVTGAVRIALDKKAEDVVVLDLRKADSFTDYFVICTGANPRQITAIADGVQETLKQEFDERPALAEGVDRSEWILLDYFNFVVHIFSRDCRAFYGLERLWGNAQRLEVTDESVSQL